MDQVKLTVVGTPDLPTSIRTRFEGSLLKAHERLECGRDIIGYRIAHRHTGITYLSNILADDDGLFTIEDDRQEAIEPVSEFVPCRRDYHICPVCLQTISAHAHVIEDESDEDRPYPAIGDAWDRVTGSGLLCGGNRCVNPPQSVVWTKADGTVETRRFCSTWAAAEVLSGVVQWDPGVQRVADDTWTNEEVIDLYESLDVKTFGTFVRRDLDPDTGEARV